MLANFASPWNCIYSAAKLEEDPLFPKTHVLGTGPFVFVEHVKGDHWTGKRWDKYFLPGKPYLDGFRAEFIAGPAAVKAMESGRIMAQFRSFTPTERDEMIKAAGDRLEVREGPWITYLALVFNATRPPFDDARVRRALSLAIDRWHGAETLADNTFLKYVGGLMRPGTATSMPEAELVKLPGFSHDIAASRAEARRLLAEAGVPDLAVTLTNRKDVPVPYGAAGDFVVAAWREIGVQATQELLSTKDWQTALETGRFAAATDLAADYFDDPTIQLARYVSRDLSPINHSGSTDRFLDALYIGQALNTDPTRARQDRARFRAARSERRLYGAAPVVEPHRRHRGKIQRLEHVTEPLHRPRPRRRVARGVRRGKCASTKPADLDGNRSRSV